jgi:shikimate kinase
MNLFLIGYRGSGKTTVAAALAEQLGWPWLDADAELERRAGKSIKQIFADTGEQAFRDLESAVIADLAGGERQIIALGGGAILREQNRQAIAARGRVVWLQASPETLLARIQADPTTAERRPNLTGQGGLAEIRELLAARTPLYAACADLTIDAERLPPDEIAREIITSLSLQDRA